MAYKAPTGTADLLPEAAQKWTLIQEKANEVFSKYGYLLMETPSFEHLDVFARGIGEATDVVGKEMFLVFSRQNLDELRGGGALAGDILALRPEGTAGVARSVVQHSLVSPGATALKVYYTGSMYRYERPQKGRLREFHQIGVECIGAAEPTADAEVIEMMMRFFVGLGIPEASMQLKINSMGDEHCRPAYRAIIRDFILGHPELCEDCARRADTNPLRAFDCKNERCQAVLNEAPKITDMLCEECLMHYQSLKDLLGLSQIEYIEDHRLVRGLDYYTRTVFEVQVTTGLGSQNAIGGGGRYDRLIEEYGGAATPGLGFAIGFERMTLVLDELGAFPLFSPNLEVYIAAVDDSCRDAAYTTASRLRLAGISCDLDHQRRSLKSQFKAADKNGARWVLVIGPDELASDSVTLRAMETGVEAKLSNSELIDCIKQMKEEV
ncbi:MAG: histidine--tRNA ligase [Coriobacteriia bacterium]|nr:histidine--tRNA ligase [Coriobacteriia bacterium]